MARSPGVVRASVAGGSRWGAPLKERVEVLREDMVAEGEVVLAHGGVADAEDEGSKEAVSVFICGEQF